MLQNKRRLVSLILMLTLLVASIAVVGISASAEEKSATLSFDDTSKRTVGTTSQQVWTENGITFTNDKASSTSNVNTSYFDPVRLYANSSATIVCNLGNITKIEVTCNSSSYATVFATSAGGEATASGSVVTIVPTASSNTYTINSFTAQTRVTSLTVYYSSGDTACEHANTTPTTVDATCTTDGSTTVVCDDCGATVSTTTIDALGHSFKEDGSCSNGCSTLAYTASFSVPDGAEAVNSVFSNEVKLPTAVDAPLALDKYEYVFAGWAVASLVDTTDAPTLYNAGVVVELTEDVTFYAVYTYKVGGSSTASFEKTDIDSIKATDVVVITMTNSTATYAMSNNNGTNSAPSAVQVEVSGDSLSSDIADTIKWNIKNTNGTLIIYPNGDTGKWLYCTSANNGVRVGTNTADAFCIDEKSGYIKHNNTGRYLGVYNNADWRCYTNTTVNIANQTLAFYVEQSGATVYYTTNLEQGECAHENASERTIDATCTTSGSVDMYCPDCETVIYNISTSDALGHNYVGVETKVPTCLEVGEITYTCSTCSDSYTAETSIGKHNFVDDICTVCEEQNLLVATNEYIFSDYTAGLQHAENEKHVLDPNVSVTVNDGHFTTQLRLYDSTSNDSTAIIKSERIIGQIVLEAGENAATLNVYGSTDGEEWTLVGAIATTKSYVKYSIDFASAGYTYIKLDAEGAQVRVSSMAITSFSKELVKFLGAGLRYENANGETEAYYMVNLRFGYQFAEGVSVDSWGWNYQLDDKDVVSKDGQYMTSEGVTNIVFTDITQVNLKKEIKAQLWFVVTVDGVEYTVYDSWQTRTAYDVLTGTEASSDDSAAKYATSVLEAYKEYLQNGSATTEDENA